MTSYCYDRNLNIPGKIETVDDDIPYNRFVITIEGITYSFNVDYIPKENWEWFSNILSGIFNKVVKNSKELQRRDIEEAYDNFKVVLTKRLPSVFF